MRKSIRSPGVASSLIEVGSSLSNKTLLAKKSDNLAVRLPTYCRAKQQRHCLFDELPNLRFEHVRTWNVIKTNMVLVTTVLIQYNSYFIIESFPVDRTLSR